MTNSRVRPAVVGPPTDVRDRLFPRLGARTRRVVLITHIASTGVWLGMDVVLAALVVSALDAPPPTAAAMVEAIGTFVGWPLVGAALLALVSGVVLGLGSKYGLLRYWWVAVKLVITIVLIVLVLGLLVPGVAALAATSSADVPRDFELDRQMLYPPIVSTTAVLIAMALSVIKPWGRR